jgi:hypothetical protein
MDKDAVPAYKEQVRLSHRVLPVQLILIYSINPHSLSQVDQGGSSCILM